LLNAVKHSTSHFYHIPECLKNDSGKSRNQHSHWNAHLCAFDLVVEPRRIELLTSCVQSRRSPSCSMAPMSRGLRPLTLVGLGRFELPTSPLSGVRYNQLSYRPNRLRNESSNSCGSLWRR